MSSCHADLYVDLSDLYVDLSDLYVDLSNLYVDLSLIYLLKTCSGPVIAIHITTKLSERAT